MKRIDILKNLFCVEKNSVRPSYSATMRYLRKNDPAQVKPFMICFKKSFESSLHEQLDNPESIALMEAYQTLDLDPRKINAC